MTVPVGVDLLRAIARALGNGAMLLIVIDRIKDADDWTPPKTTRVA
jgi:hypothetical protein